MFIIGNPANRRVGLFQAALARRGSAAATVIPWISLVESGAPERVLAALPEEPAFVRIDSFGEDFDVERAFLARGYDDALALGAWAEAPPPSFDRGRIFAPRQAHCGFLRVLEEVEAALAKRPWLDAAPSPASIRTLFDKRACATTFARAGVPIPRPLARVEEGERLFVKLSCGSSASCLALYDRGAGWLFTSMEIDGDRLYNSLRPRRYTDSSAIGRLLEFLLREGSHIEEAVPKARSRGQYFDTRMLVTASSESGTPDVPFTVMRRSVHPVTNLHLGGTRGTLDELHALISPDVFAAAQDSCRRVFSAFDCLHLGVDVMFTDDRQDHRILEANAFGDLLPNLENDGRDVWDWQLQAIASRRRQTVSDGMRSSKPAP